MQEKGETLIRFIKKLHTDVWRFIDLLSLRLGFWVQNGLVRIRSDSGQTVAEYALVLLVVAAIAVAFLLWARSSGKLDAFFDLIFDKLVNSVDPAATPAPTP
jgi:hypothetical protein